MNLLTRLLRAVVPTINPRRTPLAVEIEHVEAAQTRDEDRARALVGTDPVCCRDCALGACGDEGRALRDRLARRGAWLRVLRDKAERARGTVTPPR